MCVVQVVKRMKDRQSRQIVSTKILESCDSQLDPPRTKIRPGHQQLHQEDRICVGKPRTICPGFPCQTVERERIAARSKSQHCEIVNSQHFIVIEMSEAAQKSLIK